MPTMQPMIPITLDLAKVPDEERRALCTEAIQRGVPFEVVVREAMIAKGRESARRQAAAAAAAQPA